MNAEVKFIEPTARHVDRVYKDGLLPVMVK